MHQHMPSQVRLISYQERTLEALCPTSSRSALNPPRLGPYVPGACSLPCTSLLFWQPSAEQPDTINDEFEGEGLNQGGDTALSHL